MKTNQRTLVTIMVMGLVLLMLGQTYVTAIDFLHDINIYSNNPQNNATYNTSSLMLNVTLENFVRDDDNTAVRKAWYNLDNKEKKPLPLTYEGRINNEGFPHTHVIGVTQLSNLSVGKHIIVVDAEFDFKSEVMKGTYTLTFFIDTTLTPTPTVAEFPMYTIVFLITATLTSALLLRKRSIK